jgi:RNA polymerase sigma factor (sigma-70 family)
MAPEIATTGLADFRAAHSSLLDSLHAQSQAARWNVSQEAFSAALFGSASRHFGPALPATPALEAYLRGLHLDDLALACTLRHGSEAAWTEFLAAYRPLLYAAARAIVGAAGEARARELADSLYSELYGVACSPENRSAENASTENRRPLLDYFHGRSKLATWLRAVLAQRHIDSLRIAQRLQPLDESPNRDQSDRGDPAHPTIASVNSFTTPDACDPDRQRLIPHLREAFSESLAALPPPDRLLLSLYYVQELTLAQIARLRGVHEATISRQLERLRRELRANTQRALAAGRLPETGHAARAGLSTAEIQLCFAYALEDWPFDLASQLRPNAASQDMGET